MTNITGSVSDCDIANCFFILKFQFKQPKPDVKALCRGHRVSAHVHTSDVRSIVRVKRRESVGHIVTLDQIN